MLIILLIVLLIVILIAGYHGIRTLILLKRMGIYGKFRIPDPKKIVVNHLNAFMNEAILGYLEQEKDSKQVLGEILSFTSRVFKADSWSLLLTPKEQRWYFYTWSERLNHLPLDEIAEYLQREGRNIKELLDKKDIMVIKDTRKYPYWHRVSEVITWMGAPLMLGEEVSGVLSLDWFKKRRITKFEVELLREITGYIEKVVIRILNLDRILLDARIDPITEIYNRKSLEMETQKNKDIDTGIIFIDLDNFKRVNDLYGHATGDNALKVIAQKIRRCVREEDRVFRYGGDEFVVLVKNANESILKSIIERIKSSFKEPVKVNGNTFKISVSMGFSLYPKESQSLKEAIEIADRRMYKEKSKKRFK